MEKEIHCQTLEQINSPYSSFKFLNQITSLGTRTPQYCQNLIYCLICNTFFIYLIIPNLHAPWQLFLFLELQVLNNNPILFWLKAKGVFYQNKCFYSTLLYYKTLIIGQSGLFSTESPFDKFNKSYNSDSFHGTNGLHLNISLPYN